MSERAWVATRKGLFEWRRARGAWRIAATHFLGEPVSAVLPADPRVPGRPLLAALALGHFGTKCHASTDGGRQWSEVAAPAYPPQPAAGDGDVDWTLQLVWTLAGHGETIWAGTLPGGLFRSDDGARTWALDDALWSQPGRRDWFGGGYDVPGIHSVVVDARAGAAAPSRVLVGISCGGVWASEDAGAHWSLSARGMRAAYLPPASADDQNVQDPHRIVACASSPDHLWCQHHNGIFRSHDGGRLWREVTGVPVSNFGFAVAAHPTDPECAWFVPAVSDQCRIPVDAALAVLRTRDGGRSFDVLRDGLPQSHCYDLVYRHALAVAGDGRTLMMGSTTGGLWASADAGDRWENLGATLPPVYAVAFDPS